MNKTLRLSIAAIGIFGLCSALNALTIGLEVSDSHIQVGETFDVDVSISGIDTDSLGDLISWAFEVDPLSSLSNIVFQGAVVNGAFDDASSGTEIVGLLPFLSSTGSDIHLATLSFFALSAGLDTLELGGQVIDLQGLLFLNDDLESNEFDVLESQSVEVVPDSAPHGLASLAIIMGAMVWVRKRKSNI